MRMMTGEIGKLIIGDKQVGGFRGWTAIVYKEPIFHSIVVASGFWMLETINTDKVMASFYCEDDDELELVCEREAIIKLPESYPLDKLVIKPVEMTFEEDFDWRDG